MQSGPNWLLHIVQLRIGWRFPSKFVESLVPLILLMLAPLPVLTAASGAQPGKNVLILKEVATTPSAYMFDFKALRRWHIRESSLRVGSILAFREPSLWQQGKWIWTTGLLVILVLSALIFYMRFSRKQLKVARDRLLNLSGMLINAEERERSRLASELHDDFSQRLAVLSLKLQNAAEALPSSPEEANLRLADLQNSANEIGADLHALSHRLHSSTLESLGLVPGIRALCREFSTQQGIEVSFSSDPVPESVPPDAALCLFRIVQEGLRNLQKHSGVAKAKVILRSAGQKLAVSVCDQGIGFDLRELQKNQGLGIRSMENRAHFLGGHFEIRSALGKGTRIDAWVPLHANQNKLSKDFDSSGGRTKEPATTFAARLLARRSI